jgi:hypothetical protein
MLYVSSLPGTYGDDLYTCDCTTAYKGADCEIKKDFCEEFQFPCQNGATCISIDSTFVSDFIITHLSLFSVNLILFIEPCIKFYEKKF